MICANATIASSILLCDSQRMSNLKWVSGLVLGCALVVNACSSDSDDSAGGAGAKGEAGAAGEAPSAGDNAGSGGSGVGTGEAGAPAAGAENAGASEGGAAGAPVSTGGTSSGGTGGTAGTAGTGGTAPVTCMPAGDIDVSTSGLKYMVATQTDPDLVFCRGTTYTFVLDASVASHPFWIKKVADSTGVGDSFDEGVTGNGHNSGSVVFTVPADAPATLYYHCQIHAGMGGTITIISAP